MHVENDKNICCEVEKEWKKCIIRWCPSWFKPLPFIFQLTKNLWLTSIDEKIIMFTHVAPTHNRNFREKIARLERGEKCKVLPQEWALFRQRCLRCSNKVIMF